MFKLRFLPKIGFHALYFTLTVLLFLTEVAIAKFITGTNSNWIMGWIRGYLGDVLVVMLIYTALLSVFRVQQSQKGWLILATFAFACGVEISQYFKLAEWLGFAKGSIGYTVLGNTFSVEDLLCYALGCALVYVFEYKVVMNNQ